MPRGVNFLSMRSSTHVTVRIPNKVLETVDAIATADERSRGYVIKKALAFFLEKNRPKAGRAANKG